MNYITARPIVQAINQLLLSATHEDAGELHNYSCLELLEAVDIVHAEQDAHAKKKNRISIPSERKVAMLYLLLDPRFCRSDRDNTPSMAHNGSALYLRAYEAAETAAA